MCKDAPQPDPLIGESAKMSAEIGKEALAFYKETYEKDIKPRQARTDQLTEQLVTDYLDTSAQNKRMAQEQLARQKGLFFPVEEQMVRDAMGYDSPERMQRVAGQAAADVNQQFSNARAQGLRALTRYGINPNTGAFADTNAQLTTQQALGAAGAQNMARQNVQDRAIALRGGAANFGRGLGTQAATGFSTSLASNQGAGGQQSAANQFAIQGANVMGQGFSQGLAGYGQAGDLAYKNYSAQLAGFNAENAGMNALMGGIGTGVGMWAGKGFPTPGGRADGGLMDPADDGNGGKVSGPGGERDDVIPARLSNGEYVIPAPVVRKLGVKHFDSLIAKHGSGQNKKALAQRKGLKGSKA